MDVGLTFVVGICVGSTSWCTRSSFRFGWRVFSACIIGVSLSFPCYSAWESAVAVLAMVAARVSVVGILGL